jgi:hypothetical protein
VRLGALKNKIIIICIESKIQVTKSFFNISGKTSEVAEKRIVSVLLSIIIVGSLVCGSMMVALNSR